MLLSKKEEWSITTMDVGTSTIIFAFAVTLFAGLSTGVGGLLAIFTKQTNTRFLSLALGFSAGVMIYLAFVEILVEANEILGESLGAKPGAWAAVGGFFVGIILIALIEKLIPEAGKLHEMHTVDELDGKNSANKSKLMRTGVFTAFAIAIHNFPEGIATFMAAIVDPALGVSVAIAIAIHNIPEGIAVAVPIYHATGNKKKAFNYSLLSGLTEPLGALVTFLFLYQFMNDTLFGLVFAFVAGIMVYISIDLLLPAARENGDGYLAITGLIAGMAVMALSLLLMM